MDVRDAIKERRTIYGLGKDVKLSNGQIQEMVKEAVMHAPSAFNSQSARTVVLLGQHHVKLWGIVKDCLRKAVPADAFAQTEEKIDSFAAAYGTILFFDDSKVVKTLQEKFPLYKDNFPVWAQQSNGMLQYMIWILFGTEEIGVSLQHYNPLIDEEVKKQWELPQSWDLIGQMPFGSVTALAQEKEFAPIEERVKFFE